MILLVSGSTKTVRRLIGHPNLGVLLTPADGNSPPPPGIVWAADNGCFSGFDDERFRAFLRRIADRSDCRFVCAPDVVGDSDATADLWPKWRGVIVAHGLRPAFVIQDGCCLEDVPWTEAEAIFVGGSTRYKTGEEAARILAEAARRNVWTHMGRVNTARRLLFAMALHVRSVDGSSFSRYGETHIPWALRVLAQQPLFPVPARHSGASA